ncbi:unnamed protein product [Trichobilharzia regenti]|nr:unnamed protein product [Trichobilharzia regenti]
MFERQKIGHSLLNLSHPMVIELYCHHVGKLTMLISLVIGMITMSVILEHLKVSKY